MRILMTLAIVLACSNATAAPCPSPVAGAGVPAVACERTGS